MYVYIWKDQNGAPIYVGLTKRMGRANPKNSGGRNWLTRQKLAEIGPEKVVVEFHTVTTIIEGQSLERKLIQQYGRIQLGNGTLTNLREGGEGVVSPSPEHRAKLSAAMKDPNHPIRSIEARAKQKARMQDPDVRAKFCGENNPAKKAEVRAKLKAKWQEPEYREARRREKIGKAKHSEAHKENLRNKLLSENSHLREYHKTLNTDPNIAAKRAATLRSPEQRARQSAAMKAYWEKRKAISS